MRVSVGWAREVAPRSGLRGEAVAGTAAVHGEDDAAVGVVPGGRLVVAEDAIRMR